MLNDSDALFLKVYPSATSNMPPAEHVQTLLGYTTADGAPSSDSRPSRRTSDRDSWSRRAVAASAEGPGWGTPPPRSRLQRHLSLQRRPGSMTFSATLHRARMASTVGGMRRLLKFKGTVPNYIRQAVQTGVYRSNEELAAVWKERQESADDLSAVMKRFRQDIVRGTNVQDYPVEYLILRQHPPIPDPPRVPRRIARKMREAPNPTKTLVEKYMARFEKQEAGRLRHQWSGREPRSRADGSPVSTEEYYRRLFGMGAAPAAARAGGGDAAPTSSLDQKPAAVQRAYAAAVRHHQLRRTQGLTDAEALAQVEAVLATQDREERMVSRERASRAQEYRRQQRQPVLANVESEETESSPRDEQEDTSNGDSIHMEVADDQMASIFQADRPTVEGMMRWSERLRAVPYVEWTVGASTALDHWIARRLLGLSEDTWAALLEGEDPALLSRGRDIVMVREALFPETRIPVDAQQQGLDELGEAQDDFEPNKSTSKSIEELLASLSSLRSKTSGSKSQNLTATDIDPANLDARIEELVGQLQNWRRKNTESPFNDWSNDEKEKFNEWMKDYIDTVSIDAEKKHVDYKQTRDALLSQPPISSEESDAFWNEMEDEDRAEHLLAKVLENGPPPGAGVLHEAFWALPHNDQLERLLNLGAIRPLVDEYAKESDRRKFLQRYGDTLLKGVVMEHLVPDPEGPVQASEIAENFGYPRDTRFRLEMKAYQSSQHVSSEERTRAMFVAWNSHKAGRARYEEKLFQTGRLGLRYTDRVYKDNEIRPGEDDEEW